MLREKYAVRVPHTGMFASRHASARPMSEREVFVTAANAADPKQDICQQVPDDATTN